MSSIWERIQAQKVREEADKIAEQAREATANEARLAEERTRQQDSPKGRQQKEIRLKQRRDQILASTGILKTFQKIERGLPAKERHAIIYDPPWLDVSEYQEGSLIQKIKLAWGKFDLEDGEIVPTKGFFSSGQLDYDYIEAEIHISFGDGKIFPPETLGISIGDKHYANHRSDWENSLSTIPDAIARHYLQPFHVDNKPKPPDYGEGEFPPPLYSRGGGGYSGGIGG